MERVDDLIEELTRLLIKQDIDDKKRGKKELLVITKVEAIRRSIKLLKLLKK